MHDAHVEHVLFHQVMSAKDTVKAMIDHMTNPQSSTHIDIVKGIVAYLYEIDSSFKSIIL